MAVGNLTKIRHIVSILCHFFGSHQVWVLLTHLMPLCTVDTDTHQQTSECGDALLPSLRLRFEYSSTTTNLRCYLSAVRVDDNPTQLVGIKSAPWGSLGCRFESAAATLLYLIMAGATKHNFVNCVMRVPVALDGCVLQQLL